MNQATITTGDLCKLAGTTRGQLRLYERDGLLDRPARTAGGYRVYSPDTIARLRAIRQLKELGLTLSEIAALLGEHDHGEIDEHELQMRATRLMREIDDRLSRLQVVRQYVAAVAAGDMTALGDPDCSFLVRFLAASDQESVLEAA